nr:hypothetical protein [uncultured Flavobacterium sp.]
MKIVNLSFYLIFIVGIGCKKTEVYGDNYHIESRDVVYGIINFGGNDKTYSKKILNKDSIRQFIQDLNDSEYIGICEKVNKQGFIGLVVKDSVIKIEIIDNKIRIPIINKCYKLNQKYINASH